MPIEISNDFLGYHAKDGEKKILTIQIFEVTMPDGKYSEKTICEIESIERYGANPRRGLLFSGEFRTQEESAAEDTVHGFTSSGDVYESYPGRSRYCTQSDSEEESEDILDLSKTVTNSLKLQNS